MGTGEWKDVFSIIDEDHKGSIPTTKMGLAIRASGGYPTEDQVKTMIAKADPSGSGKVSLDAFLKQREWIESVNPLDINEIGASFKVFDKDGNGCISKVELAHILTSMGDKLTMDEADDFVKEAYLNKDGVIDYMAFLEQVTQP
jgi:Ca2+-binding EF-hand superfamily protein